MIYNDLYEIDLQFNDKSFESSVSSYDFSIHDSIYSFFPNAKINIPDASGLFREYLIPIEGNYFTIIFGDKDNVLKNKYVIISEDSSENKTAGIFNNDIKPNLRHAFYNQQSCTSKAYSLEISKVVEEEIKSYKFNNVFIDQTSGKKTWYKLFQTQEDFICNVLLPRAYSYSSSETPFFCFINSNNEFYFKSYESIYTKTHIAEITYVSFDTKSYNRNNAYSVVPFNSGSDFNKKERNIIGFKRDLTTGEFSKENFLTKDFPNKKENNSYLPISNSNNEFTSYIDFGWNYTKTGLKEQYKGLISNSMRKSLFYEHLIITLPFNPLLRSGETIKFNSYILPDNKEPKLSSKTSGKYIIEDCVHSWSGSSNKKAITQIIVGRKFINVPNDYSVKNYLIRG